MKMQIKTCDELISPKIAERSQEPRKDAALRDIFGNCNTNSIAVQRDYSINKLLSSALLTLLRDIPATSAEPMLIIHHSVSGTSTSASSYSNENFSLTVQKCSKFHFKEDPTTSGIIFSKNGMNVSYSGSFCSGAVKDINVMLLPANTGATVELGEAAPVLIFKVNNGPAQTHIPYAFALTNFYTRSKILEGAELPILIPSNRKFLRIAKHGEVLGKDASERSIARGSSYLTLSASNKYSELPLHSNPYHELYIPMGDSSVLYKQGNEIARLSMFNGDAVIIPPNIPHLVFTYSITPLYTIKVARGSLPDNQGNGISIMYDRVIATHDQIISITGAKPASYQK